MQAGRLKYTVQLLKKTVARDPYGAETIGFIVFATVPADVRYKSGNKVIEDMALVNSQYVEINIRFKKGIDETMIVKYGNRFYRITSINEIAYRQTLQLIAERITDMTFKIGGITVDSDNITVDSTIITADKITK